MHATCLASSVALAGRVTSGVMLSTRRSNAGRAARTAAAGPVILKKYGGLRLSTMAPTIAQSCLGSAGPPMRHAAADVGPGDVDGDDVKPVHGLLRTALAADVVELRNPALDVRLRRAAGARDAHLDPPGARYVASRIAFGFGASCQASGTSRRARADSSAAGGSDPCGEAAAPIGGWSGGSVSRVALDGGMSPAAAGGAGDPPAWPRRSRPGDVVRRHGAPSRRRRGPPESPRTMRAGSTWAAAMRDACLRPPARPTGFARCTRCGPSDRCVSPSARCTIAEASSRDCTGAVDLDASPFRSRR